MHDLRLASLLASLTLLASSLVALGACATSGARDAAVQGAVVTTVAGEALALDTIAAAHDATVLVWWSSTCPCVRRYEARVRDLAARMVGRPVAFYYVSSNADDGPERLASAAPTAPLPIVRDEGGVIAERLGVTSTPTVVVLDRTGRVRFTGWLDNEHPVGDPDREAWLEDALARVVATDAADGGGGVERTPTWGCMVTRSLGQVGRCHGAVAVPTRSP
ncbi:MAG: redoxin family protein [Deltaproteobacteria bacterium]|nr:redoxin family protein [Deltaproteobacteria bacterium]